jgi:hypothetical protein
MIPIIFGEKKTVILPTFLSSNLRFFTPDFSTIPATRHYNTQPYLGAGWLKRKRLTCTSIRQITSSISAGTPD